ncbi:guanine nucleotide-binding protein subunit gamma 3-like [Quillaja saponaria]|uniref:Guanine nucleotide-binding protein subunit gamma 3-like n=1 Tax=Quillaja saponaria TaxID=32244 RepID=A0AAD7LEM3_QUISA|nr:guanine nucleotide-binding protein subunit gamma 3-like [Quillaja saponaria]
MANPSGGSSTVPSLPPPNPKSPTEYPDLYGKRREMAKVQMLEREISFLEADLKSVEGLQPASRCCKEVADFVLANSDPLLHTNQKNRWSCGLWKWLCRIPCLNLSWICCCCYSGCSLQLELPRYCDSNFCSCLPSCSCSLPKWWCCSCPRPHCCKQSCCCQNCWIFQCFTSCCPDCSCCRWKCSCPTCPKVRQCCCCTESCWKPCCLCY